MGEEELFRAYQSFNPGTYVDYGGPALGGGLGIGSLLGPASIISTFANFVGNRMDEADARRIEAERQRQAALDDMVALGMDPRETYSPENLAETMTDWSWADDPNLTLEDISGQKVMDAIQTYIAFNPDRVAPGAAPISTPPAATTPAQSLAPVDYVKDVMELPGQIWEDPSSIIGVILGPGGITGNVVWGDKEQPIDPKARPAIYTGKIGDKVYTGTSTGDPTLDAAIRRVLGQTEGGETTTMDVVVEGVQKETGLPVADVVRILKDVFKDSGVSLPSPTTPTTPTGGSGSTTSTATTGGGQTTDQQDKVTVGTDTGLFDKVMQVLQGKKTDKEIRDAAEAAGVTPEEIAKVTGVSQDEVDRRWEGAGGPFDTSGNATVIDTTTGQVLDTTTGQVLDTTVTQKPVVDLSYPTATPKPVVDLGPPNGPTILDTTTDQVLDIVTNGGGGGGGGITTTATTPTAQGIRGVSTEKAGVADIRNPFDLNASLAENILRILASNENGSGSTPYYGGGKVRRGDLDELIRLIRG